MSIPTLPATPTVLQADGVAAALALIDDIHDWMGNLPIPTIGCVSTTMKLARVRALLAAQPTAPEEVPEAAQQNGGLVRAALIDLMTTESAALNGAPTLDQQNEFRAKFARGRAALAVPAGEPVMKQPNPHAATFPAEIWLQVGECDAVECTPFDSHAELTWCWEGIDRMDVRYIRADIAAPVANAGQAPAEAGNPASAQDCEICDGTLSAFGKRCTCTQGGTEP